MHNNTPNPTPISKKEQAALYETVVNEDVDAVAAVKNLHCKFYDQCLDVAEEKNWGQFGCNSCQIGQAMDSDGRLKDHYGLVVLRAVADRAISNDGKPGRKRGNKGR
jgi:hypothetical protein